MTYIVRYPKDESDAGVNVGPFDSSDEAEAYLATHPAAEEEWDGYIVQLVRP